MARIKPCECGAPKELGKGKRYCQSCRESKLAAWQQAKIEDDRRRYHQKREDEGKRKRVYRKDWPEGQAWCGKCEQFKPLNRFAPAVARGTNGYCRPCYSTYLHARLLQEKYGITSEDYDAIFESQDQRCYICANKPRTMRLAVDHDHKTGEVRGLLCKRCNRDLLGGARDDVALLQRAIDYLTNPPARIVLLGRSNNG